MFRYISQRISNTLSSKQYNIGMYLISTENSNVKNHLSKSFNHLINKNNPISAYFKNSDKYSIIPDLSSRVRTSKMIKIQNFNFSFGKFNLYRFNKEINSRYTLKDYTKNQKTKDWLEKKSQNLKSNLK